VNTSVIELTDIVKDYRGLRPLRVRHLTLGPGEQVALLGVDRITAEVFINLVTGATLPDQGQVRAFGRLTTEIPDADTWLAGADRFGIVSERAVLLEELSVLQNLAMPFSLEIDPPSSDVVPKAAGLAAEAGIVEAERQASVASLTPLSRMRVRLARSLAFGPEVLLVEHPTAGLPRSDIAELAEQIRRVAEARQIAALNLTADREFADRVAGRVLTLEPATGRVSTGGRGWFFRHR
jgi:ABC-type transporter Mla maintaining outer membrane lipid asymmetry ATPase subunit MlaF